MKTTRAKVIKIGNSYGVRLRKSYLDQNGIRPGDSITIQTSTAQKDSKKALAALAAISSMNGTLANTDIDKWQEQRRQEQQKKDDLFRDILGR